LSKLDLPIRNNYNAYYITWQPFVFSVKISYNQGERKKIKNWSTNIWLTKKHVVHLTHQQIGQPAFGSPR